MNKVFVGMILLLWQIVLPMSAQQFPTDQNKDLVISIIPVIQAWKIKSESDFSQLSSYLNINYNFLRYTKLTINGAFASTTGDVEKLNGFSDSQIALSQKFDKLNLVLDAGVNIPSGKTKLNDEEFSTSKLIGQDFFNMRVSNYGQGLNLYFGGLWAFSASDNVVLGLGTSYQIRGEYEPYQDDSSTYKPSDELLITAGADFQLGKDNALTTDITAIFYGSDKINDEALFDSGDRIVITTLYKQFFGLSTLYILAGYRHQMLSHFNEDYITIEDEKVNPDNIFVLVQYIQHLSKFISLGFSLKGNFYESTPSEYSGYNIFEYGLSPIFSLSKNIQLPFTFKFISGSTEDKPNILGYEAGFALKFLF
ncbi:MAG: hypothetical protein V1720_17755 [bacterium]